jgi:hypothetical protein
MFSATPLPPCNARWGNWQTHLVLVQGYSRFESWAGSKTAERFDSVCEVGFQF